MTGAVFTSVFLELRDPAIEVGVPGLEECLHLADLLPDFRADVDELLRELFVQTGDPFGDEPYLGAQTLRNDVGVPLDFVDLHAEVLPDLSNVRRELPAKLRDGDVEVEEKGVCPPFRVFGVSSGSPE